MEQNNIVFSKLSGLHLHNLYTLIWLNSSHTMSANVETQCEKISLQNAELRYTQKFIMCNEHMRAQPTIC